MIRKLRTFVDLIYCSNGLRLPVPCTVSIVFIENFTPVSSHDSPTVDTVDVEKIF